MSLNGNEGIFEPVANKIIEYEGLSKIGIGASFGCEGQIWVPEDRISLFADFTQKFVKHYLDMGAAKREAETIYAENFWRVALLSLEKLSGLSGTGS